MTGCEALRVGHQGRAGHTALGGRQCGSGDVVVGFAGKTPWLVPLLTLCQAKTLKLTSSELKSGQ
jgi:hypothetical protein